MNVIDEYFWKASLAFQANRIDEAYEFMCQAIERFAQTPLTLEQLELIWSIIPSKY